MRAENKQLLEQVSALEAEQAEWARKESAWTSREASLQGEVASLRAQVQSEQDDTGRKHYQDKTNGGGNMEEKIQQWELDYSNAEDATGEENAPWPQENDDESQQVCFKLLFPRQPCYIFLTGVVRDVPSAGHGSSHAHLRAALR